MKKLRILLFLLLGGVSFMTALGAQKIPMQIIKEGAVNENGGKSPVHPWYITQDDYVLTLPALSDDCTLELLDEDGDVIYTTWLPVGATSVVLPSTLSGEYELRLIPSGATYYYRGYIEL